MEFIFKHLHDAIWFHEHLYNKQLPSTYKETKFQKQKHFVITVDLHQVSLADLQDVIITFITHKKRKEWTHEILFKQFYYEDEIERAQISEIVCEMFNGKRPELTALVRKVDEKEIISDVIQSLFDPPKSVSFNSFFKFRFKKYFDYLIEYIEVAIDEYKMEQDYQVYIQMLRDYIYKRERKKKVVHIYMEKCSVFYDKDFQKISSDVLTNLLDKRLLTNHPIYIDSKTIAPLLSIAPEKVYVYTNKPEQGLIRTMKNIFEERMHLCSTRQFWERKKQCSIVNK